MRLVAACSVLLAGCASWVLLWPPKPRDIQGGVRRELIAQGAIEVIVAPASAGEPQAYVLRFYGNGDAAYPAVAHEAAELAGLPIEIWGVNYPGYGQSRGKATLDGVAHAARTAYAELAKRGKPIIVMGSSMGTTAALHLAATERVAGVVLHNPVPLRQLILRRHGWWNLWLAALPIALQIPDALDTIANARRAKAPALFVSSGDDGVVPIGYQERIMKAYAGSWELLEMRGAGHNDPLPPWVIAKLRATLAAWITLAP